MDLYCVSSVDTETNSSFLSHYEITAVQNLLTYSSETNKKPPEEINDLFSSHRQNRMRNIALVRYVTLVLTCGATPLKKNKLITWLCYLIFDSYFIRDFSV